MADKVLQPATAPPLRMAWFLLLALLVVALVAGIAFVGSRLLPSTTIPQGGAAVLAYASASGGSGDIFTVRADGTDRRQLTSGPGAETTPAFSPDGTRIAYFAWEDATMSVMVMDAGGGHPTKLATTPATQPYCVRGGPLWSPDSRSLIYPTSPTCDARIDLFIVGADGSSPATRLLADGTNSVYPAWSPDGKRIAFLGSDPAGGVGLYVTDVGPGGALSGGLAARRIGTSTGDLANVGPDIQWSPDGTKLVAVAATAAQQPGGRGAEAGDLVIVDPDGSGSSLLAEQGYNPRWSPDGQRIAFHRQVDPSEFVNERPCTARMWVIDADGTDERRLDDLGDGCDAPPLWSPDGTRLSGSFVASTDTEPGLGSHLGIVTVDGSSPTVILEDGPSVSWQPVAAPLPPAPSFSPAP